MNGVAKSHVELKVFGLPETSHGPLLKMLPKESYSCPRKTYKFIFLSEDKNVKSNKYNNICLFIF